MVIYTSYQYSHYDVCASRGNMVQSSVSGMSSVGTSLVECTQKSTSLLAKATSNSRVKRPRPKTASKPPRIPSNPFKSLQKSLRIPDFEAFSTEF